MSLRADSRLRGRLDFGCMKRCDFWRAKRAENFPHHPTCFPHNQHFLPHNVPENFRTICYFFPHPIRCPVFIEVSQLVLVSNLMRKLHNSRNYAFASFLVGLLQYNPSKFINFQRVFFFLCKESEQVPTLPLPNHHVYQYCQPTPGHYHYHNQH